MPNIVQSLAVTCDTSGNGTVTARAVRGDIVKIRMGHAGTAVTALGGTTDFKFVDSYDGGTVFTASNQSAPWEYFPAVNLSGTQAGTTAYSLGVGPVVGQGIPVGGSVTMTVSQGQPSASGTVFMYWRV